MKNTIFSVMLPFLATFHLSGCPTCIGHIEKQSPPFFSDEFYQKDTNAELAKLYEQCMREQHYETVQTTSQQQSPKERQ